ncbi:ATP-binding cassette sub-family G member 4-like [Ischnura elegans]|uniref:ATP-binding cassette sub-family G member 4-like n=1 Tax=Ischnura elegans TaxID=197161 RepID=UPI001ED89553|nr:ATP-binding cassette sub-family G member 4-like [Ischnura elegans]
MRTRSRAFEGPLVFRDVTCTVRDTDSREQRTILKGVSGCFKPGRLTAIIGPSGSGKTTLMNILSGFRTRGVKGSITVGGEECVPHDFRHHSSYIEQEVAMMAELTARETMTEASQLKMPRHVTKEQREKTVTQISDLLGLGGCMGTKVCKLSGGERKRLSIAVELVTNPPIMFFDEPTSNLDSVASQTILSHLRCLADSGRVVICVVHQPSSKHFTMFDDLFVLSHGEAIYYGGVSELVPFLKSYGFSCPDYYNPSDFVIEVACGEHGTSTKELVQAVKKKVEDETEKSSKSVPTTKSSIAVIGNNTNKEHYMKEVEEEREEATESLLTSKPNDSTAVTISENGFSLKPPKYSFENGINIQSHSSEGSLRLSRPPTMITQMKVLLWRSSICTYRNLYLTQLTLFGNLFIGLLLGGIFYDIGGDAAKAPSNAGCLFFFLLFLFFANAMPTVQTYPVELPVVIRQYRNGWFSLRSYFIAKCLADVPMQVITPTVFLLVSYYLTGQPTECFRVAMMWTICVSYTILAQGIGLVFGAAFPVDFAVFLVPLTTTPMLLFSGFFVHLGDLSAYVSAFSYVSHTRYMYEGMMQAVYGFNRSTLMCTEPYCHFRHPEKLLKDMSIGDLSYWSDLGAIIAFVVLVKAALYLIIRWKVSMKQ